MLRSLPVILLLIVFSASLSAQFVGIGTNAPQHKLHIVGATDTALYSISNTKTAAKFVNLNMENLSNALEVYSTGAGSIPNDRLGNAAFFQVDNINSVGAAVRARINSVFGNMGAAAVYGESAGPGGAAGFFHASNPAGNGVALKAVNAGNGNAFSAFSEHGHAVQASTDGAGHAFYGIVPATGTGSAVRLSQANVLNSTPVVYITTSGTGDALYVNHTGIAGNLLALESQGITVARINRQGKGFFNGGTQTGGADVAEYFDVEGSLDAYQPGDVLVISTSSDRKVQRSSTPYSNLVAGVYATKPGIMLTEREDLDEISDMVPMGVIGVIPTKVNMEGGPVKRGDMLVTSSEAGVAMKADPDKIKPGQVIGKALQDYNAAGTGLIKVLVSIK